MKLGADFKLRTKLVGTVCVLLLLACGIIAAIAAMTFRTALTQNTGEALLNMARQGARLVCSNIDVHLTALDGIASRNVIRSMDWSKQQAAMEAEARRLHYLAMAIVSPNHLAHYADGSTSDLSGQDFVVKAFEGKPGMSGVIVNKATSSPEIMMATPVQNDDGSILAVLVAHLPATILTDVTDQIRYRKGGYAYVIDGNGTLIAHDNRQFIVDQKNFIREAETKPEFRLLANMLKRMTQKQTGFDEYSFLGKDRFFGYAPIAGSDWSIAVGAMRDDVLSAADTQTRNTLLITAVVLLLGVMIIWFVALTITSPLQAGITELERIKRGDMSQDLPSALCSRKDEAGDLARGIQTLIESLRPILSEISKGVQTLGSSSSELSAISGLMTSGMKDISANTSTVAKAAEESSFNTTSVAKSVEQATSNLSSVACATEEMSATITEIASKSEKARAISAEASLQAQGVSSLMNELGQAAQKIGQVTETITNISSQTNLLALNATIEAARAGAAGKGFAVVANEIKELAQQTAAATEDIKSKIGAIQASTGGAIATIGSILKTILQVGDLVTSIATAIEEQSVVTRDVASSIAQASVGVQESSANVSRTADVSQSIARDIASVNRTVAEISLNGDLILSNAAELSNMSGKLQQAIHHFKWNGHMTFDPDPVKSAHQAWVNRTSDLLANRQSLDVSDVTDHHECAFGKWYYGEGKREFGSRETFRSLEATHAQVHSIVREIALLVSQDRRLEASAKLRELMATSRTMCEQLDQFAAGLNSI